MLKYPFLFCCSLLFVLACKTETSTETTDTFVSTTFSISPTFQITLLDSLAATKVIIKDKTDNFFENISTVDIAIQTKQNYSEHTPRVQQLESYRSYLQQDVTNFTKTEADFVQRAFILANERLKALKVNVLPQNIDLIKTTARHYGESAYYTREDGIVIPYDVLTANDLEAFTNVMLHEIFHIYSRNHPDKQLALYELIGFRPIENINFPAELAERILLNPDGVNQKYSITLKNGDSTLTVIPLIVSNEPQYQTNKQQFFDYLYFDLFPIKMESDSSYTVLTQDGYKSPIHFADYPDFFEQIGDNTDYIIHPDEVLADNFILVVNRMNEVFSKAKLSKEGEILLEKIAHIINSK